MSRFALDRMGDAFTLINKVGSMTRAPALSKLAPLAERMHAAFEGEVLYDVYYSGEGLKSISYTEIFSQALLVCPCNDPARYALAQAALEDDDAPVSAETVLAAGRLDKYQMIRQFERAPLEAVIFLPGSNLLEKAVDWFKVRRLVEAGAIIKPHPITNDHWLTLIAESFPGENIAYHKASGFDYLSRAEHVYTTNNSELGLLALLLDKQVGMVDAQPETLRPMYRQLYKAVLDQPDPKAALEKVIGSRHAGFYWHWQGPERAGQIVTAIKEFMNV